MTMSTCLCTAETMVAQTRNELDTLPIHDLKEINTQEYVFWKNLRQKKTPPRFWSLLP